MRRNCYKNLTRLFDKKSSWRLSNQSQNDGAKDKSLMRLPVAPCSLRRGKFVIPHTKFINDVARGTFIKENGPRLLILKSINKLKKQYRLRKLKLDC